MSSAQQCGEWHCPGCGKRLIFAIFCGPCEAKLIRAQAEAELERFRHEKREASTP